MSLCEMCGKDSHLITADVEGVDLRLCSNCKKYGEIKKTFNTPVRRTFTQIEGPVFLIVKDYSTKIRQAREAKGMNQAEFADFLNERTSIIQKWETNTMRPRIGAARRIGKILNIRLLEKEEESKVEIKKIKSDELTLGDFIKVRKRN